jgi:hypothetical protein
VSWHNVAIEQVLLGRPQDALTSLEKALLAHEMSMVVVGTVPAFDALRGDPRFLAILVKIQAKSSG